jgi:hypothetical protein
MTSMPFPVWITVALLLAWVLSVVAVAVFYWIRLRPVIKKLQETDEGRRVLIKTMFPPRFHK